MAGAGVNAARRALLADLSAGRPSPSRTCSWRVFSGELRQGALDGVMVDAVAKAAGVPVAAVRRAHMLAGDLGATAAAALAGGVDALARGRHGAGSGGAADAGVAGRPTSPPRSTPTGPASVEWKLDGARIQAHRRDGEVRLFTRNLNEITDRLGVGRRRSSPALPGGDLVLDGEALGVDDEGTPRRFQDTMGDFGADAPTGRGHGLSALLLRRAPRRRRRRSSTSRWPCAASCWRRSCRRRRRLPSIVTADAGEAAAFLDRAVGAGHEGVMVKALDAPYDAGRRGGAWRKVKPVHTLDLVVLAAEWGHGRRTGLAVEPPPRRPRRRRRRS